MSFWRGRTSGRRPAGGRTLDPPRTCPDRARWEQFLAGELDSSDETLLEEHLEVCEACRDRLVLLAEWPSAVTPASTPSRGEPPSWLGRIAPPEPASLSTAGLEPARIPRIAGFERLEEIGRGGMGIVYRAHQIGLDRPVAVKVLSSAGHRVPAARVRALREARVLARLNHPNIVRIHEIGETADTPYIVMEWVDRGDLADRLAHGPLPPREAANLARQVALAVAAAHQRGIIHRDIKPRNILLAADESPRLTDFGLAREVDSDESLTATGLALGTPGYQAPEQLESRIGVVGPAADIYALGATLYAMLVGRPPFQAARDVELLRQVVDNDPVPPRRLNDTIPRDLDTICRKCLEKRPERRYASADALAADLGRFLEGRPILARPIGPIGSLWRRSRRHPAISALAALVAMLLLAMILGSVLFARRQVRFRAIAEANADHARRVLDVMARGMEASLKAIRTMNASSQPELRNLSTKHLDDVAAIYDGYFRQRPAGTPWIPSEVRMLGELAELRGLQGREEDSERLRQESLDVGLHILDDHPTDLGLRCRLAESATWLAVARAEAGDSEGSLADFERAYRIARDITPDRIADSQRFYVRSMTASNLSGIYHRTDRHEASASIQAEALRFARDVRARRPDDRVVAAQLIEHLCFLATERNDLGKSEDASPLLDEAESIIESLANGAPTSPGRDLATLGNWIRQERDRLTKPPGEP